MSPNADFSLGDAALFYVTCPQCQSRVELPDYDTSLDRIDSPPTICDNCGLAFVYSDQEVRHVAHDLMPEKIAKHIPPLYATEHEDDPLALLKWFTPDSSWTWFITEYDPLDRLCFGLVHGHEREMGYFSLDEIESLRGPMSLRVERDLYWEPRPISQCS